MRNVNLSSFSGCSLFGERLEEIRVLIRDILPRVQIPEVLSTAPNCNPDIAGLSGWRSGSVGGLLRAKRPSVRTTIRDISHIVSYQERDNMHQNTGRDYDGNSIRLVGGEAIEVTDPGYQAHTTDVIATVCGNTSNRRQC